MATETTTAIAGTTAVTPTTTTATSATVTATTAATMTATEPVKSKCSTIILIITSSIIITSIAISERVVLTNDFFVIFWTPDIVTRKCVDRFHCVCLLNISGRHIQASIDQLRVSSIQLVTEKHSLRSKMLLDAFNTSLVRQE